MIGVANKHTMGVFTAADFKWRSHESRSMINKKKFLVTIIRNKLFINVVNLLEREREKIYIRCG